MQTWQVCSVNGNFAGSGVTHLRARFQSLALSRGRRRAKYWSLLSGKAKDFRRVHAPSKGRVVLVRRVCHCLTTIVVRRKRHPGIARGLHQVDQEPGSQHREAVERAWRQERESRASTAQSGELLQQASNRHRNTSISVDTRSPGPADGSVAINSWDPREDGRCRRPNTPSSSFSQERRDDLWGSQPQQSSLASEGEGLVRKLGQHPQQKAF